MLQSMDEESQSRPRPGLAWRAYIRYEYNFENDPSKKRRQTRMLLRF
ncbi:hypothetical protein E2C01_063293 [Portunus trituberculatus]|uniref:Uncharacterized protein n=1 Tax=Portunus trituberculatus TaxID=210409 RepID=A0A5B7HJW9_PORTR|nr:hypothetical protein [Portunus trituberculatus]